MGKNYSLEKNHSLVKKIHRQKFRRQKLSLVIYICHQGRNSSLLPTDVLGEEINSEEIISELKIADLTLCMIRLKFLILQDFSKLQKKRL